MRWLFRKKFALIDMGKKDVGGYPDPLIFGCSGSGKARGFYGNSRECVKDAVCKAIDNIPPFAGVVDCHVQKSTMQGEAWIKLRVKVMDDSMENVAEFNNSVSSGFDSGMACVE